MKRIVILIDGTWNAKGAGHDTNVAKLASTAQGRPLILDRAPDGISQVVRYHDGVGSNADDVLKHILGGSIGLGLREIVLDAYRSVVETFEADDDLIIGGFSRGAYAARALAAMIGCSGIQRRHDRTEALAAWRHYRTQPDARAVTTPLVDVHAMRRVKCVAVWDTVGSYGVPAGFGLDAIGRYLALAFLGFHDTSIGAHIENGLHAVAVDEHRRPFVPTLWTAPKNPPPKGHVEQTWFAGAHGNVGGGEADAGLSDEALLWMIARLEALTGLAFDHQAVCAATQAARLDGDVIDSTAGWLIDHRWPHFRAILSPDAIEHGALTNSRNAAEMNVNERVHWSVIAKRGRPCRIYGQDGVPYGPPNLPATIRPDQIAAATREEEVLFRLPSLALSPEPSPTV